MDLISVEFQSTDGRMFVLTSDQTSNALVYSSRAARQTRLRRSRTHPCHPDLYSRSRPHWFHQRWPENARVQRHLHVSTPCTQPTSNDAPCRKLSKQNESSRFSTSLSYDHFDSGVRMGHGTFNLVEFELFPSSFERPRCISAHFQPSATDHSVSRVRWILRRSGTTHRSVLLHHLLTLQSRTWV